MKAKDIKPSNQIAINYYPATNYVHITYNNLTPSDLRAALSDKLRDIEEELGDIGEENPEQVKYVAVDIVKKVFPNHDVSYEESDPVVTK